MTTPQTTTRPKITLTIEPQLRSFASIGIAGIGAAVAALVSYYAKLPLWAIYIGWILFHTRQRTFPLACLSLATIALGLVLGIAISLGIGLMIPYVHLAALPIGVFISTVVILASTKYTPFNNFMAWFLGIIAILASGHDALSLSTFLTLMSAIVIGTFTGWLTHRLQPKEGDH